MIILLGVLAFVCLFLGIVNPFNTAPVQPKVVPTPEVGAWFHAPRGAALVAAPTGGFQVTGRGSDITRYHPARVVAVSGGRVLLRVEAGLEDYFPARLVTLDTATFWHLFRPGVCI